MYSNIPLSTLSKLRSLLTETSTVHPQVQHHAALQYIKVHTHTHTHAQTHKETLVMVNAILTLSVQHGEWLFVTSHHMSGLLQELHTAPIATQRYTHTHTLLG